MKYADGKLQAIWPSMKITENIGKRKITGTFPIQTIDYFITATAILIVLQQTTAKIIDTPPMIAKIIPIASIYWVFAVIESS